VSIRLLDWRLRGALVDLRLPFRFGIAEVRQLAHAFLFASFEVGGERVDGVAAENLAPKWFTKDPDSSYREDAAGMVAVVEAACERARGRGACPSVFDLWYAVYRDCVAEDGPGTAPLLSTFGVSMLERAAIDAFCRAAGLPFAEAVRTNSLGVRLGALHRRLGDAEPRELLPARPLASVRVRHTVGLADALVTGDVGGADPEDGLPATLEAAVRRYGLRRFKVKVGGEPAVDAARLGRVAEVLERETAGDYRVTLDANEQYADAARLRALWDTVSREPATRAFAGRIDYVEQPFPRHAALEPDTAAALASWPGRPAIVLDESDDVLGAVARAVELGYDGGSFKSCKGVFKGIGNACRLEQLRQEEPSRGLVYSAEDLTTIGPVGLPADLAVIAALGIDEPERNGYHYLRGSVPLSERANEELVRQHGDLFALDAAGSPLLRVEAGRLALGSVVAAPFGAAVSTAFEDELDDVRAVVAGLG
jgi:hypothetical protein